MSPPKYVDLVALAAALAIFALAGLPLLGYAVAAVIWLAQRGLAVILAHRASAELGAGRRRRAMGILAASALGRVWLMITALLVSGLIDRRAGLSAAILVAILFTISFLSQGLAHLLEPEGQGAR